MTSVLSNLFSPQTSCKARGRGQGATIFQGRMGRGMGIGTTKSLRGFVDNSEARRAPGIVQLFSAVEYSSKDDL